MTPHGWLTIAILGTVILFLVKKWLPVEVTALATPVVLHATGVLPDATEALAGFSNKAVIALGAIFVVGAGLREAGVTSVVARLLQRASRAGEAAVIAAVMIVIACVSAFMSNVAVTAVFLPAVMTLSRRTGIAPSRLLIPLAFGAVLGGNLTQMGTTSNITIGDWALANGHEPVGFFHFGIGGVPIVVAGILFMVTLGRRLLPTRTTAERLRQSRFGEDAARDHNLDATLFRMRLVDASKLRGRTVAEIGLRSSHGVQLLAVVRSGRLKQKYLTPSPDLVLASGDELYIEGSAESAWRLSEEEVVQFGLAGPDEIDRLLGRGLGLAEVTLAPRSRVLGKSIRQLGFRNRHGLDVLSLWRRDQPVREGLSDLPLALGDAFLVSGAPERLRELSASPDFIVLTDLSSSEDFGRAPLAVAILLLAVVPPALGLTVSLVWTAVPAALLMISSGCISVRAAQRAIDWRVIFLLAGTLPLGRALTVTGAADTVAAHMISLSEPFGPAGLLAGLFAVATLVAITTSNAASAAIVAPLAAAAALASGLPVPTALLAVAFGANCAYVLPYHQWNLIVMAPGGYSAADFMRVGSGLSLVVAAVALTVLSLM